jgi:hypothetical protein
MNLRDVSLLEKVKKNLDELIEASKPLGRLSSEPRKLVAGVSSRAKWLRKAVAGLQAGEVKGKPTDAELDKIAEGREKARTAKGGA